MAPCVRNISGAFQMKSDLCGRHRQEDVKRAVCLRRTGWFVMVVPLLAFASSVGIVVPSTTRAAPRQLLPPPQPLPVVPEVHGAFRAYRRLTQEHYVATAAVQMGVVRGVADVLGQHLHGAASIDGVHVAAMMVTGLSVSGAGGAMWLRHLESRLGPSDGTTSVLRKTVLDYTCWAPTVNCANLLLVSLLTVRLLLLTPDSGSTHTHLLCVRSDCRGTTSRRRFRSRCTDCRH